MMSNFLVLVRKELKSIRKEKTIMFAIMIQFLIASFSSIMLVGIMAFYDPGSIGDNTNVSIKVAAVGDLESPVVSSMAGRKNVKVYPFPDSLSAQQAFRQHRVDAVMNLDTSDEGTTAMELFLPESDTESTLILMLLDDPLKKAETELRQASGVKLNYANMEGKSGTDYEFLYGVIVPLLMLFPGVIAGSIVIDTISEETENKTLDTLWASPVSLNSILSSKICAAIGTAALQCILWVVLLQVNGFAVANLGGVLILSILIAAAVSFGAGIIAVYFKDRERSQFIFSLALVATAGVSYLLTPSPFGLITKLAIADQFVGYQNVVPYTIPLIAVACAFFLTSRKLILSHR